MRAHVWRRSAAVLAMVCFWLGATAWAQGLPDFVSLVKRVSPAVVNISTTERVVENAAGSDDQSAPGAPFGDWLHRFFGNNGGDSGSAQDGDSGSDGAPHSYQASSLGSGFIISADGYILTNFHVVKNAQSIVVKLSDRREFPAKVVGHDALSDIALLKIDAHNLPVVQIGSARDLQPGQWVVAIGSPYGFDHSVTAGIVSALRRSLSDQEYVPFIQTDVPINPGNSGGPLLDTQGQVVGINSQIYSRTGGYMGLSFAIPINVAMHVVKALRAHGHVTRGWLGVVVQGLDLGLAKAFGLNSVQGALVARVLPHSPAARAGLKVGDVILRYDGQAVDNSGDLPQLVGRSRPGDRVKMAVWRQGAQHTLSVSVGTLPQNGPPLAGSEPPRKVGGRLGLVVQNPTDAQRQALGLDSGGVVVAKVVSGAAQQAGIESGDALLRLGGQAIRTAAQFKRLVKALPAGKSVAVLVQRQNQALFLALGVPAKAKH